MRFSVVCGRFLGLSFTFRHVDENVCEDDRGEYSGFGYDKGDIGYDDGDGRRNISLDGSYFRDDIRVDNGIIGSRSKDTSHF